MTRLSVARRLPAGLFGVVLLACSAREQHVVITLATEVPAATAMVSATDVVAATAEAAGPGIAVALDAGVPADLLNRPAARSLRTNGGTSDATLSVAHAPDGVVARYWVPVTDLFNDVSGLSSVDLVRALRGGVQDWKELGGSAAPLQLVLPAELRDELVVVLGPDLVSPLASVPSPSTSAGGTASARPQWLGRLQVPGAVELQRGSLALLPLEDVDWHVRALPLDGIDLLRGTGDLAGYPLVTRVAVTPRPGARAQVTAQTVERAIAATVPSPERLLATGDIIPARCVYDRQRRYNDYRHAFLEVAPTLRTADLAVGSLDASISDKGTPIGCQETFSLLAPAESVQGLSYAGIGLLTIAANHAKDCGESACGDLAFLDTMARLDTAGIAHAGGGKTLAEARTAAVVVVKGVRFAFLGYDDIASQYYGAGEKSPGTAPLDLKTLAADVRAAKARSDVVIVMVHWGVEYTPDPTDRQREAAKIAVEAGAALVVGNHPHVVQAVEAFPTGFADYALGNFVFDQDWSQETLEGVVMECIFDGPRLRQVTFLPLRIQDMHQPHFVTREQGRVILDRMQKASLKLIDAR